MPSIIIIMGPGSYSEQSIRDIATTLIVRSENGSCCPHLFIKITPTGSVAGRLVNIVSEWPPQKTGVSKVYLPGPCVCVCVFCVRRIDSVIVYSKSPWGSSGCGHRKYRANLPNRGCRIKKSFKTWFTYKHAINTATMRHEVRCACKMRGVAVCAEPPRHTMKGSRTGPAKRDVCAPTTTTTRVHHIIAASAYFRACDKSYWTVKLRGSRIN